MEAAGTANDDGCRICCVPPWKRRRSRYPMLTVTVMMFLMMFYCFIRAATAAARQPKTVAMAADDAVVWTPSAFVDNAASPSLFSDRSPENVDHGGLFASLPQRDESSGRDRHGSMSWRALIAVRRPVGPVALDVTGRRSTALTWPEIVNNSKPPATTTATVAGMDPPTGATASVNVAPVITTPLGRHDRLPRIQIKSNSPCSRSSFGALDTSFQQPNDLRYLPTSAPCSLIVANSIGQLNNDLYSVQSKLTPPSRNDRNDSGNKYTVKTAAMDDGRPNIFSDISEKDAGLGPGVGRDLRHKRRERGVESADEVDQQMLRSESGSLLNAMTTSTDGTSTETLVVRLSSLKTDEQLGVSLRAAALRYRSRGNFAALVDPLKSGRASASVGSASANKWRQLETAGDNSTSPPPVTEETTSSSVSSSRSMSFNDSDSIEINVIMTVNVDVNDSTHAPSSVSVSTQPLNDSFPLNGSKAVNSSLATSGEWNCSKATASLGLQAALKLRLSTSTVALSVYTLSFLFTLVAAWSITSVVFSLCIIRSQQWSLLAGRRWYSQLVVLGFVAMAAASRALYYVAAEYHLLATIVTPASWRMIYECWFPFIIAAFFFHQRLVYVNVVTKENEGQRVGFCCEVCIVILALCFCLAFVVLLCLLIEYCIVPVLLGFVLRFAFALFAVLLSVANVYRIATSSGRDRISTQVVFCPLFVICAGFFVVDAATFLSSDFAHLFQKNAVVLIAVETADRLAELFISALLCAQSSRTVFRLQRKTDPKSINAGQKEVRGKKVNEKKVVNYHQASVSSTTTMNPQKTRQSWLNRLLDVTSKSKVVDVAAPSQISLGVVHSLCWASTEDPSILHGASPLPPPSRVTRSRSMLYNDHGFIRFRLDGDTDGESDARTLEDDDGGPGQARSLPASEYASADDLSLRRGPSSAGTPRWSRPGTPSLTGFRPPSIHLQDSIDRALDRCDIWRVGCEQGQLNVDELRRIVQLYGDVGDCRRGNRQRRAAGIKSISYAEV